MKQGPKKEKEVRYLYDFAYRMNVCLCLSSFFPPSPLSVSLFPPSLSLSLPPPLSLSISLPAPLSIYLTPPPLSLSISLYLTLSPSLSVYLSLSLATSSYRKLWIRQCNSTQVIHIVFILYVSINFVPICEKYMWYKVIMNINLPQMLFIGN